MVKNLCHLTAIQHSAEGVFIAMVVDFWFQRITSHTCGKSSLLVLSQMCYNYKQSRKEKQSCHALSIGAYTVGWVLIVFCLHCCSLIEKTRLLATLHGIGHPKFAVSACPCSPYTVGLSPEHLQTLHVLTKAVPNLGHPDSAGYLKG